MDREERSSHPNYYQYARDVLNSSGLGPGFPQQFAYVEAGDHPSHVTRDKINIHVNGETGILQGAVREPTIGAYRSMVEDFPFDATYQIKQQRHLQALGFASLILAVLSMGVV